MGDNAPSCSPDAILSCSFWMRPQLWQRAIGRVSSVREREKARAFKQALEASGQIAAGSRVAEIDRLIAVEIQARLRCQTEPECVSFAQLPDGAMFDRDGKPFVKWSGLARHWSLAGYGPPRVMDGMVGRLTPVATLNALRQGFRVDAIKPS